ncbi:MAG: hypothetical protein ACR2QJ_03190 [Geminicoccaceae bacterium]
MRASADMLPEVIVHHLDQAEAALRAAGEAGKKIQLRSAPDAAASAGVGYLRALGDAAGQDLLIDCGDDAGLVMAALRSGCHKLLFAGSSDERQRLNQIAAHCRAKVWGPSDLSTLQLALSPDDDAKAVLSWLKQEAEP